MSRANYLFCSFSMLGFLNLHHCNLHFHSNFRAFGQVTLVRSVQDARFVYLCHCVSVRVHNLNGHVTRNLSSRFSMEKQRHVPTSRPVTRVPSSEAEAEHRATRTSAFLSFPRQEFIRIKSS